MTGPLKTVPCKRCQRLIAWVVTPSGSRMPLDPSPNPAGNVFVTASPGGPVGTVSRRGMPRPAGVAFVPHFATCSALNPPGKATPVKPPPPDPPPTLELDL